MKKEKNFLFFILIKKSDVICIIYIYIMNTYEKWKLLFTYFFLFRNFLIFLLFISFCSKFCLFFLVFQLIENFDVYELFYCFPLLAVFRNYGAKGPRSGSIKLVEHFFCNYLSWFLILSIHDSGPCLEKHAHAQIHI